MFSYHFSPARSATWIRLQRGEWLTPRCLPSERCGSREGRRTASSRWHTSQWSRPCQRTVYQLHTRLCEPWPPVLPLHPRDTNSPCTCAECKPRTVYLLLHGSSPVKYAYHMGWGLTAVTHVWIRPSHNILYRRTSVNRMKMYIWITRLALCRTLFHPQSASHCSHFFYRRCHRLMVVLDVAVRGHRGSGEQPAKCWPNSGRGMGYAFGPSTTGVFSWIRARLLSQSDWFWKPGCRNT